MGLLGAGAPEATGGLGLGDAEILLLCEEAGRVALPEPFVETAGVLIPTLAALGAEAGDQIPELITGAKRGVVVHPANRLTNLSETADFAMLCSDICIAFASPGSLDSHPQSSIDPGRSVACLSGEAETEILSGGAAKAVCAEIAARGAACTAAELCGLTERMIALATDYASMREQFGKPIGSFQAVKHLLANAQVKLEFARPVVYRAGAALSQPGTRRDLCVSHAKLAASDAATFAAEQAIQVFGGMGYTFEVDLHFFMKRAWALSGQWGDRSHHMARVEAAIIGEGCEIGPGPTFTHA